MKKVLILSDSHGKNDIMEYVINKEKPDYIIHCGDHCLNNNDYLNRIFDIYVQGNNDYIGEREILKNIEGLIFLVLHGDEFNVYSNELSGLIRYGKNVGADIILYGHSHVENYYKEDDIILINPGSITYPRNKTNKKSYAIIHINNGKIIENNLNEIVRYI